MCFDLRFSNDLDAEHLFLPFVYHLWRNAYLGSWPIFESGLLLSFWRSVYSGLILSQLHYLQIFPVVAFFPVDSVLGMKVLHFHAANSSLAFCYLCLWCQNQEMTARSSAAKLSP